MKHKKNFLNDNPESQYEKWKCKDPLPKVEAALLNSADILAYVNRTAMIYPFEETRLKGASYDVPIEGTVLYWDEEGKKRVKELKKDGDYFDLSPNSIAFVTLEPYFRIPFYIALRFNLKITHIYKGLLLGTGPLVDPGFCGKLSIPLHNLTANTYRFFKGDELITMEFTKMSKNAIWRNERVNVGHSEKYIKNEIISNRTVDDYVAKALKKDRLGKVISSIPNTMLETKKAITIAEKTIKDMKDESEHAKKWSNVINIAGIVGIATVVINAVTLTVNSYSKSNEKYEILVQQYEATTNQYENMLEEMQEKIDELESEIINFQSVAGQEEDMK